MHANENATSSQNSLLKSLKTYFSNMQWIGGSLHHGCLLPKATMGAEFIKRNPLASFQFKRKLRDDEDEDASF